MSNADNPSRPDPHSPNQPPAGGTAYQQGSAQAPYVTAQPAYGPAPPAHGHNAPPRRKKPMFTCLVMLVAGIGLCAIVLLFISGIGSLVDGTGTDIREKHFSHNQFALNKIAIIHVEGVIYSGEGFAKKQIDAVIEDESVKAVVLRVNSPGGTVSGSDYLYHHLTKLREEHGKPIVVSMGTIATSGGYYVSMAVGDQDDAIFAEPTTWTGSIGVLLALYQGVELMNKIGIEDNTLVSHDMKDSGSFTKPLSGEGRLRWQKLVNTAFDRFKEVVRSGRPALAADEDTLDRAATGEVFATPEALSMGLVDKEGFLEEAVERAIELADLPEDDVKVIEYENIPSLSQILMHGSSQKSLGDPVEKIMSATQPKAYYLCPRMLLLSP